MVFARESVDGVWKWGSVFCLECLRAHTDFTSTGAMYEHIRNVLNNGRKMVNRLHSVARRLLLLAVMRPTLEYGSEVWEANKSQAAALESVVLGGEKRSQGLYGP